MAIMGILAVIGIGTYTQATMKSRDTERKSDLNQLAKALESYNNDMGGYPKVNGDGEMLCQATTEETECNGQLFAFISGAKAIYMEKIPTDTDINNKYVYIPNAETGGYSLYAALENTQDKDVVVDTEGNPTTFAVSCGLENCNYQLTETGLVRTN